MKRPDSEAVAKMGLADDFELVWAERREKPNRSKHHRRYTFMAFKACDYVHYDEPVHIENRLRYWQYLDWLLEDGPLGELDQATKTKIHDEFESVLPTK